MLADVLVMTPVLSLSFADLNCETLLQAVSIYALGIIKFSLNFLLSLLLV